MGLVAPAMLLAVALCLFLRCFPELILLITRRDDGAGCARHAAGRRALLVLSGRHGAGQREMEQAFFFCLNDPRKRKKTLFVSQRTPWCRRAGGQRRILGLIFRFQGIS